MDKMPLDEFVTYVVMSKSVHENLGSELRIVRLMNKELQEKHVEEKCTDKYREHFRKMLLELTDAAGYDTTAASIEILKFFDKYTDPEFKGMLERVDHNFEETKKKVFAICGVA